MLDSAAQRQKAYLGHGKGLQSRRLPSHIVSKVGDDYYQKRKSYDPKVLVSPSPKPVDARDRSQSAYDQPSTQDREKEVRGGV